MSVTFNLYKINHNVEYLGCPFRELLISLGDKFDEVSDIDIIKKLIPENEINPEWKSFEDIDIELFEKYTSPVFSDGNKHRIFDIDDMSFTKERRVERVRKDIIQKHDVKTYSANGDFLRYLIVDEAAYNQGWYLKRGWLNQRTTVNYYLTKKGMNQFFKKNLKKTSKDPRVHQIIRQFNEAWTDDGDFIFCVSF